MKKLFLSICILLIACCNAFATHIRAGEITYRCVGGYSYEITVTTWSNTCGTSTDDCEVNVYFGDGDSAVAPRVNGPFGTVCASAGEGEIVVGVACTRKNIYTILHTYDGPGNYTITSEIPNRNDGICNINGGNSDNTSFSLHSEVVINPFFDCNNSSILTQMPIDEGCIGQCFEHNPGAYDADGDSLYYKLIPCYAGGSPIIPGFVLPPNMNWTDIDPNSGDIRWCAPNTICQYNIALKIEEWKKIDGVPLRYYAGSVVRDMQINIVSCLNTMPTLSNPPDTCVVAGSNVSFNVTANDAEFNNITLSASGGPFLISPSATFTAVSSPGTATGTFSWTPGCNAIQLLPYMVTFKALDSDPTTPLANYESSFIKVVPPPPTGLTAIPGGSMMVLNWTPSFCADTTGTNPLKRYLIYRKNGCTPWIPGPCETGVPSYSGYTFIGQTFSGSITTYTDNNGGAGLLHGVDYSYLIVAVYSDGSQSFASTSVCARLVRDVPIITNVSVLTTNTSGQIWTHWTKPIANVFNLDTIAYPPPYEYRLMKAAGMNPVASAFTLEVSYTYAAYWQLNDTGFVSTMNTVASANAFRIDFYSNGALRGSTHTASSVFLSSTPSDNKVSLSWQENVPWVNNLYYIFKELPVGSSTFVLIDSTILQNYVDSNLVNGITYCYKVQSRGAYSDTTLPRPLYNMSQIKCDTPIDLTPPCQPAFTVTPDCETPINFISWDNPNNYCCDDAIQYNIYYAETTDANMELIYSTTNMNDTTYSHVDDFMGVASIAGCYTVTAVDSFANESPVLNTICVDNCPAYELPNVFTPNGDGINDFVIPLPYRFVKDVEIKIYDRWGLLMFETTDPDIMWDGRSAQSKGQCPDGTYFYICTVNEIRVKGITPRTLKGFIQLINTKTAPTK